MTNTSFQDQIDDATLDFTLGNSQAAIDKLTTLASEDSGIFGVWHALTEIYFTEGDYDAALEAADRAHGIDPEDIHINTSLSRIWVELGDKDKAEQFGAKARMLGWKDELKSPAERDDI
ncbi:MAG: tetratricopeptide repeat protein [Verrucomicrobiota bacterium]|nr:tetratricopeptide repeat protein [Verrucomicrobiota bacterium]